MTTFTADLVRCVMSKTENLYCRQEVANEWLDREPTLVNYIAERMHTEIGKALADKICDGKVYRVAMEKPHIEIGDVGFNKDTSVYRSKVAVSPMVMCQDCKYWEESQYFPKFMVCTYVTGATFTRQHDDFCSKGERREP